MDQLYTTLLANFSTLLVFLCTILLPLGLSLLVFNYPLKPGNSNTSLSQCTQLQKIYLYTGTNMNEYKVTFFSSDYSMF